MTPLYILVIVLLALVCIGLSVSPQVGPPPPPQPKRGMPIVYVPDPMVEFIETSPGLITATIGFVSPGTLPPCNLVLLDYTGQVHTRASINYDAGGRAGTWHYPQDEQ